MATIEDIERSGEGTYRNVKQLTEGPYAGHFAHTAQMLYTVGIQVSHSDGLYVFGRWCYPSYVGAKQALDQWNGVGDPPGEWIVRKGIGGADKRRSNS
jgi:hypothetical protein